MKGRTEDSIIDLVPHFILFLSKISKNSNFRHICVGLRTSRLLVYLLGRQLPVPHVTFHYDVIIGCFDKNFRVRMPLPNNQMVNKRSYEAQTWLFFRQKSDFKQKSKF